MYISASAAKFSEVFCSTWRWTASRASRSARSLARPVGTTIGGKVDVTPELGRRGRPAAALAPPPRLARLAGGNVVLTDAALEALRARDGKAILPTVVDLVHGRLTL